MVSGIKKSKDAGQRFSKNAVLVLVVAILLTTVTIICVVVANNKNEFKYGTPNDTPSSIVYKEGLTFAPTKENESNKNGNEETRISDAVQNNQGIITEINNPTVSGSVLPDASGWSVSQIIAKAADAVNKTKAYTGNLTVNHSEGFTADVTECSAGGIVRSVVDLMIGWVVKPVDETLVNRCIA